MHRAFNRVFLYLPDQLTVLLQWQTFISSQTAEVQNIMTSCVYLRTLKKKKPQLKITTNSLLAGKRQAVTL